MAKIGRPLLTPEQMLDFLQTHVRLDGDCRIWAGGMHVCGIPLVFWNWKQHMARRLLLQLRDGTVGARVWDVCGEQRCMNPRHLRTGSAKEMLAYMKSVGRMHGGPKHGLAVSLGAVKRAKLPITAAPDVYAALGRGETKKDIARRYGVCLSTVLTAMKKWERNGVTALTVKVAA